MHLINNLFLFFLEMHLPSLEPTNKYIYIFFWKCTYQLLEPINNFFFFGNALTYFRAHKYFFFYFFFFGNALTNFRTHSYIFFFFFFFFFWNALTNFRAQSYILFIYLFFLEMHLPTLEPDPMFFSKESSRLNKGLSWWSSNILCECSMSGERCLEWCWRGEKEVASVTPRLKSGEPASILAKRELEEAESRRWKLEVELGGGEVLLAL